MVKDKWKINWSSEKIMSISALFISVISLIALLYQSYLAREENRLIQKQQSASVLPHLSQWFSHSADGFKIVIGNKGVGPAFIKDVAIVYDSIHKFDNTDHLFDHIFGTTPSLDSISYSNSTLQKGFVLPANETIEIITIRNRNGIKYFREILNTKPLEFSIIYEDVYGAQWLISNRDDEIIPQPILED